jgi:uncharacterized protein YydD (DUF2326 family)
MKLSKLYSNSKLFKEIEFNEGLNVIVGRVLNQNNLKSDSHNLGKSTLIYLLDFMFLKELAKGNFLKDNHDKFKNHVFYLEIKVRNNCFITIRRDVKNHTKISLKIHEKGKQDFRNEIFWDYTDLPLTTNHIEKNPKVILNNIFAFQMVPYNFRTYLNYFLRTQYDYDQVFKLSKYRGGDITWKPAIATLLGFKGELLANKYRLESDITKEEQLIKDMESELKVSLSDLNRINTLLDVNEKKKLNIISQIDNFDFYLRERELNRDLIESVETNIAKYNTEEYKLKYEIQAIKESMDNQVKFNLDAITKLFGDVKIYFPDQLRKDYEDLVDFNKKITVERDRYLAENLLRHESRLRDIYSELNRFNKQRTEILSVLKEKDSFTKFKKYQMELVEIENEISQLLSKLDNLEAVQVIHKRRMELLRKMDELIQSIQSHFSEENLLYKNIQFTFTDLVEKIIDETAILFYTFNSMNNIEFEAKFTSIEDAQLTSKSDGYSYRKMLCVCFDLSVILNYLDKDFFRFIYHDGSLESLSATKKITYLDTITELCRTNDIQYIFTTLEDDIPREADGSLYKITEKDIVLTLDDREDFKGRLFGFDF